MPRDERHSGCEDPNDSEWSAMIGSLEPLDLDVNLPSEHLGLVFACPMCILPAIQRPREVKRFKQMQKDVPFHVGISLMQFCLSDFRSLAKP